MIESKDDTIARLQGESQWYFNTCLRLRESLAELIELAQRLDETGEVMNREERCLTRHAQQLLADTASEF